MGRRQFATFDQLLHWLKAQGIETHLWGKGAYKSMQNLWDEYEAGDITFQDEPPLRVVQVVQVLVEQDGALLVEKEQTLTSGERRFRDQPPSEKMKAGETRLEAASRCLQEELGVTEEQIHALRVTPERVQDVRDSPSYPGLLTRYTIHKVAARVSGLPAGDFWRENTAVSHGDPVRRHLWGWVRRG